jgi:hypothetical protein
MAFRHLALAASRRLLASSGAKAAGGSGTHGSGNGAVGFTHSRGNNSSLTQVARFWGWGGFKSDDDDDAAKKKVEEATAEAAAAVEEDVAAADAAHATAAEAAAAPPDPPAAAAAGGDDAGGGSSNSGSSGGFGLFGSGADSGAAKEPEVTASSPWSDAMNPSVKDTAAELDDLAAAAAPAPEIVAPKWNVPSEEEVVAAPVAAPVVSAPQTPAPAPAHLPQSQQSRSSSEDATATAATAAPAAAAAGGAQRKGVAFVPRYAREAAKTLAETGRAPQKGVASGKLSYAPQSNLYVRNLPRDFDAAQLAELFLPYGKGAGCTN